MHYNRGFSLPFASVETWKIYAHSLLKSFRTTVGIDPDLMQPFASEGCPITALYQKVPDLDNRPFGRSHGQI